jgi:hypothetical protein
MMSDIIIFGILTIVVIFGLYGWWSIERQIKKNIDDMDL